MTTIQLETRIAAPAMRVFLLSLSIDLHMDSTAQTRERAIAGVTHGLIGPGESVTWRGRHFGVMLQHTSLITRYEPPFCFEDVMTKGMFKSFEHRHNFSADSRITIMRDTLAFRAPLGPFGLLAGRLVLRSYLRSAMNISSRQPSQISGKVISLIQNRRAFAANARLTHPVTT
jgi:ligand-binding SRPBCC domain-containing protein